MKIIDIFVQLIYFPVHSKTFHTQYTAESTPLRLDIEARQNVPPTLVTGNSAHFFSFL